MRKFTLRKWRTKFNPEVGDFWMSFAPQGSPFPQSAIVESGMMPFWNPKKIDFPRSLGKEENSRNLAERHWFCLANIENFWPNPKNIKIQGKREKARLFFLNFYSSRRWHIEFFLKAGSERLKKSWMWVSDVRFGWNFTWRKEKHKLKNRVR